MTFENADQEYGAKKALGMMIDRIGGDPGVDYLNSPYEQTEENLYLTVRYLEQRARIETFFKVLKILNLPYEHLNLIKDDELLVDVIERLLIESYKNKKG